MGSSGWTLCSATLRMTFRVYRHHNPLVGGKKFSELPASIKNQILTYDISADLLIGADDPQVLQIFARLNSYSVTLNAQEKRNAKFFGVFRSTAYELGTSHLKFWIDNGILTYHGVARMAEAELVSELLVALLAGLQDKKSSIDRYYALYEDQFPQEQEIRQKFEHIVGWIDRNVDIAGSHSIERRCSARYSSRSTRYSIYGIERGQGPIAAVPHGSLGPTQRAKLNGSLGELSAGISVEEPLPQFAEFAIASAQQTDNIGPRRIRHGRLMQLLREALAA